MSPIVFYRYCGKVVCSGDGGMSRAISHCTLELGSRRSTCIKMLAMWLIFDRLLGSLLVEFLSPKAAPIGD